MKKLVAAEAIKNRLQRLLGSVMQLQTGNEDFSGYLQERRISKDHYNYKCDEFESIRHIIKH